MDTEGGVESRLLGAAQLPVGLNRGDDGPDLDRPTHVRPIRNRLRYGPLKRERTRREEDARDQGLDLARKFLLGELESKAVPGGRDRERPDSSQDEGLGGGAGYATVTDDELWREAGGSTGGRVSRANPSMRADRGASTSSTQACLAAASSSGDASGTRQTTKWPAAARAAARFRLNVETPPWRDCHSLPTQRICRGWKGG